MKILVLGGGFVGKALSEYLGATLSTQRLADISESDLDPYDVVINTVAKTSIDWCEKNRQVAFDTNVTQAVRIGKLINDIWRHKIKYAFFSSACIFKSEDMNDIQYENAIPNPQCFYTYTKLMAEQLLEELCPETLVIRPRLLISEKSHPRNTLNKLLKYDKILNTQESATILEDMLPKLKQLIEIGAFGAYNIFNQGTISPSEIMEIFGHEHTIINKKELDVITKGQARRVSTVLGSHKTESLPNIRDRINEIRTMWYITPNAL